MSEVIQAQVEYYAASTGWGRAHDRDSRRISFGQPARAVPKIVGETIGERFVRRLELQNDRCNLAHPRPGDKLFLTAILDTAGWQATAWCFDHHWIDVVTDLRSTLYRVTAHRWAPGLSGVEEVHSQHIFQGHFDTLNRAFPRFEDDVEDVLADSGQLITSVTYSFAYQISEDPEVWQDIPDPRRVIIRE